MNFWNQIPDATKVYLAVLLGLTILLAGLVLIRTDISAADGPSLSELVGRLSIRRVSIPKPEDGMPSATSLQDTDVYSGPGVEYQRLGRFKKGDTAEVVGISADSRWWVIKVTGNEVNQGWVLAEQVQTNNTVGIPAIGENGEPMANLTSTPMAPSVVAERNTEIFTEPVLSSGKLGLLEIGQRANVIGVSADNLWWAIAVPYVAGGQGWVAASQVRAENAEGVSVLDGSMPVQTPEDELPRVRAIANVNIRSGPGVNYQKVGTLQIDQEALIVGIDPEGFWWLIKVPGEKDAKGWISIDYVVTRNADNVPVVEPQGAGGAFLVTTPEPGAPTLTASTLVNIRSGPGKQYEVIGRLEQGQMAEIVGKSANGNWWAIKLATGSKSQGWVAAAFVNVTNGENVPVISE